MTPEFPFVSGAFELTGCKVPYFMLTMAADEAVENLHVARELIFDPAEIVLDELFQRDIDDLRVKSEIAPYLMRQGELKFFSALVVALLPHEKNQLKSKYSLLTDSGREELEGIKIKYATKDSILGKKKPTSYGTIRWDVTALKAIVVDGQHRYSALKSLGEADPENLAGVSIPVVLLILDSSVGFKTENSNLLSNVRKVFIDLNRQAKTVSETRNVLLDDRDPAAVLTRALMERRVRPDEHTLEQRLAVGNLPLALVDWYSDSLKFDKGIHLTSLLGLYKAVSEFLGIPKLDHFDFDNAQSWVNHFKQLDESLDFEGVVRIAKQNNLPIYLGANELEQLQRWFVTSWGPALARILTTVAPYKSFIVKLRKLRLLDGTLECWAAMDRHGKKAFEDSHGSGQDFMQLEKVISSEKTDDLAFQLVFQKALLSAFVEMCRVQMTQKGAVPPHEYANVWSDLFNERIGYFSRHRSSWIGFLVRSDDTLNVTKAAEKSVVSFIIFALLAPYEDWREQSTNEMLQLAQAYVHEVFEFKSIRGLEGWQKLKYSYSVSWRSLVRKHLQETAGVYGEGESLKCSRFMAERLVESFERAAPDELVLEIDDPLEELLDQ
jgi:DGQHR domain-containing protein